jgi:hypothetical protein
MGRNPQQPELRRSGTSAAEQRSAKIKANTDRSGGKPHGIDKGNKGGGRGGGVPPSQQPGWRPRD